MKKASLALFILLLLAIATGVVLAAGVTTSTFGDLGLNDTVVTGVDLAGLDSTEEGFTTFTNSGGTINGPIKLYQRPAGGMDTSVYITTNGVSGWQYTASGNGGYWTQFDIAWPNIKTSESDPTVHSWAKASTKPTYTYDEVGAAPESHVSNYSNPHRVTATQLGAATTSDVQAVSITLSNLYGGSNVIAQVTNYNSQVHAPKLSLLQLEDGEYKTVWAETNGLARIADSATNYTDAAILTATNTLPSTYAPRAWSKVTSGLGADVPDDETTWITTPKTVIAGGYEWTKTITSAGAVWFLASNGMTSLSTNGVSYLDIQASDGTSILRIEKTDAVLVGVDAASIARSGNTVTISIPVVSADHPYMRYKQTLADATWLTEEDGTIPSTVSYAWSGSSGAWVCTITTSATSGFFYFQALQEGSTKIVNGGAVDLSAGIYYNGQTYYPTVSGNQLIFMSNQ